MPVGVRASAIGDDHRILGGDQQPRRFGDRAGIALRRRRAASASGCAAFASLASGCFLQIAVGDEHAPAPSGGVIAIL